MEEKEPPWRAEVRKAVEERFPLIRNEVTRDAIRVFVAEQIQAAEQRGRREALDEYLTSQQVCAEYPIFGTPIALAERRWRKEGPEYVKTGDTRSGRVFYRRSAIEGWIRAHSVTPESP